MANYPPRVTSVTGYFGWDDIVNLQNWLKKRGYYASARECDGVWGYWTTYGLQGYLREKRKDFYPYDRYYAGVVDGQFGNMTKDAMGEAAWYLFGSNWMTGQCSGGSCVIQWPHERVIKSWEEFLSNWVKLGAK